MIELMVKQQIPSDQPYHPAGSGAADYGAQPAAAGDDSRWASS